jgi:release factor glutamine methyltransferase
MWADEGTIERFIDGCFHHLDSGGVVLLLISSLSGPDRVFSLFKENGFKTEVVAKRKIPWEELMVIRASL